MSLIDRLQNAINSTQAERDSWEQQGYFHHYNNAVGQIEAYEDCIQMLNDACTPRPPQAEWFGTGPGQWGDWYIAWVGHDNIERELLVRNAQYCDESMLPRITWDNPGDTIKGSRSFDVIIACKPIARKGCAPVGWQVVEVKP